MFKKLSLILIHSCILLPIIASEHSSPLKIKEESKEEMSPCPRIEHIGRTYLGAYAHTPEYAFQEKVRKTDLALEKAVEESCGKTKAKNFFIQGWGQVIATTLALRTKNITPEFDAVIEQNLEKALAKGQKDPNPFLNVNVREYTKNIMMYPHQGKYLPWKKTTLVKPLVVLNKALQGRGLRFALFEGKCYLMINPSTEGTLFTQVWSPEFESQLAEHGFNGMTPNKETAHITLINSNVISAISDKFTEKYGSTGKDRFTALCTSCFDTFNQALQEPQNALSFTEFCAAYSEDYSPYEDVLAAQLTAPYVKKALKEFTARVKAEVDYTLPVKEDDSFHVSVAIKHREPLALPEKDLTKLIGSTDTRSQTLLKFYAAYQKS